MVAIDGGMDGVRRARGVIEKGANVVEQAALIALQHQNVVAALSHHLGGNGALTVERVGGHDGPFERQQLQQFRHCRDLVRLAVDRKLTQQEPLVRGPSMEHVQWGLACSPVEGAPQRLAIDGDHALQALGEALHKACEAGFERHRVEKPEDSAKGIVAGNAVPQAQELPQERLFTSPNSAISEQSLPPVSIVHSAINSSSCKSWRALFCRGSMTSAKQATNSSMTTVPR